MAHTLSADTQVNYATFTGFLYKVMVGKPIVKGTRLTVEFIIDLLAQGWSEAEILRNYSGLTVQDIRACLAFAR